MIHPLDPLLTWLDVSPDFDDRDFQAECARLFQRQKAVDDLLSGHIKADELLDLLDLQGLDAARYADLAIGNLERAIAQGLEIDPDAAIFYSQQ